MSPTAQHLTPNTFPPSAALSLFWVRTAFVFIIRAIMKKTIYSEENRTLLEWLRACRKRKGLTMRAFAARLNVPHSWIGKVELGERRLDVVEYVRLCAELGVDPREGIERIETRSLTELTYEIPSTTRPLRIAAEKRSKFGGKDE